MTDWTEEDAIAAVRMHSPLSFPSASSSQDLNASRISGGVSNVNFRVRVQGSDRMGVVVRFRPKPKGDEADSMGKQFAAYAGGGKIVEEHVLKAASAAGIAPKLLYYGEGGDIMITKEIDGRPLSQADLKDPAMLERVLPAMNRLHRLDIPESDVPAPTWLRGYRIMPSINWVLDFMKLKGYTKHLPEDMPSICSDLAQVDALIAGSSSGPHSGYSSICHTDPVPANILACDDGSIVFVDFEYASRCHADYDIAKMAASSMFSPSDDATLHEIWTRCGGGFGDGSRPGSSLARFQAFKLFEIAFRALYCAVQCHESTLPFNATWSVCKTWPDATATLFKELRVRMQSSEAATHGANLARVKKCIVPVAGLASRIYPASKAISKCFFPVYDPVSGLLKPLIHHTVEEALAAGVEELCFIVNPDDVQRIRDYFDMPTNPNIYRSKGREEHAKIAGELSKMGERITLLVQENATGFGDALLKCRDFVNGEPHLVLLGDHAFLAGEGKPPVIKQMTNAFQCSQESTYGVCLEDEEALLRTATFCGNPVAVDPHGDCPPLYKGSRLMAYPITPEVARRYLRTEGLADGKYLVSFGVFVHMPIMFTKMETIAAKMPDARDGGGSCDAAVTELISEAKVTLAHLSGQRLDIGMPLVYAETLGVLAEAGRKRRRTD